MTIRRRSALLILVPTLTLLGGAGVGAAIANVTKAGLPARTTGDAAALKADESAVIGDISTFQQLSGSASVAAIAVKLKTAESAQSAAAATLTKDLGSSASAPTSTGSSAGKVLFSQSASGISSTTPFTVPAAAKGWHVNWTYNCSNFGSSGNFTFDVEQGTSLDFNDEGPNELGANGSGTEHYYDTGTFHLSVNSECTWTVQAVAGV
jgi:hypothetical protein